MTDRFYSWLLPIWMGRIDFGFRIGSGAMSEYWADLFNDESTMIIFYGEKISYDKRKGTSAYWGFFFGRSGALQKIASYHL